MARPLAATGVLLVGGESRRFGSPKALARLRGETLAERAWRMLGEAFEERIAVGKSAPLPLPFPVVNDGAESRAPVFGVIAGLRAATHETCVALPVDCPRVTPTLLQELARRRAVPVSGPLPGAYERALVPVLEARAGAGELTLRGVVERRLGVDERLVEDVDTPEELAALERPGHTLVVGGTGMLAGVTRALAARGHPVTVVARRPVASAGLAQLAVDYRDPAALAAGLSAAVAERGPFELGVLWLHTDAPDAAALVAERVGPGGRLVQVFGTQVWPLERVPIHVAYRQVVLGSRAGRSLTHAEISAGVLGAIDADEPVRIVGER